MAKQVLEVEVRAEGVQKAKGDIESLSASVGGVKSSTVKVDADTGAANAKVDETKAKVTSVGTSGKQAGEGVKAGFQNLTGVFDTLKQKASGLDGVFKQALGLFGGGALLKGTQLIFTNFQEMFEKGLAIKKMTGELEIGFRTAGLSGETMAKAIKAATGNSEKLADSLAVSKGAVNQATAIFLKYGGTADNIAQKQELIAALAKKGGIEMDAAAKLLAKATDPENEANLKRLGIVLDKNATDTERFNKIQEKLNGTLAVMREEAKGPIGSIERLKNALGGFKGAVGGAIIDLLAPVFDVVSRLATFITSTVLPAFKGIVTGIKGVVGGFAGLAPVLGIVIATLGVFVLVTNQAVAAQLRSYVLSKLEVVIKIAKNAITQIEIAVTQGATIAQAAWNAVMAANPIGLVVLAVGALIAGLVALYKYVEPVREVFDSAFSAIGEIIHELIPLFSAIWEVIKEVGGLVLDVLLIPFQLIWLQITAVFDVLGSLWDAIVGGGGESVDVMETVRNAIEAIVKAVTIFKAAVAGIRAFISEFIAIVKDIVTAVANLDFGAAKDAIAGAGARLGKAMKEGVQEEMNESLISDLTKKLEESDKAVVEIKTKITENKALDKLNEDLAKTQEKLAPLELKIQSGNATVKEREEYDKLAKKAAEASAEINKLAPDAVKGQREVVTATGKTITIYDVATDKVKELTKANRAVYDADMKKKADDYSKSVVGLSDQLAEQRKKQAELLEQANKTTDPKQQAEILKKYDETRKKADELGTSLKAATEKGLKNGLLTEEAYVKMLKSQGLNVEKAKEFYAAQKKQAEEAARIEAIIGRYKGKFDDAKKAAADMLAENDANANDASVALRNLRKELADARQGIGTRSVAEIQGDINIMAEAQRKARAQSLKAAVDNARLTREADQNSGESQLKRIEDYNARVRELNKKNLADRRALVDDLDKFEIEGMEEGTDKQIELLELETQNQKRAVADQIAEYQKLVDGKGKLGEAAAEQVAILNDRLVLLDEVAARKRNEIEKKRIDELKKYYEEQFRLYTERQNAQIEFAKRSADAVAVIDEDSARLRAEKQRELLDLQLTLDNATAPRLAFELAIKAGADYNTAVEAQKAEELRILNEFRTKATAVEIELQKNINLIRTAGVANAQERELQARIANLIAQRDTELNVLNLTGQQRAEISKKYNKEIADAETALLKQRLGVYAQFTQALIAEMAKRPDNSAEIEKINKEEEAFVASLKKREISWAQYQDKLASATEKRAELERQQYSVLDAASRAFNQTAIAELERQKATYQTSFDQMAKTGEIQYGKVAEFAALSAAQQIAAGKSVLKATVLGALDALNMLVPVIIARIWGSNLAEGPLGIVGAGIASAAFLGLVAVARSAVNGAGFKKGGWTGDGDPNEEAGVVHKREMVIKDPYASRFRPILEAINMGINPMVNMSPVVVNNADDTAQEIRALRKDLAKKSHRTNVTQNITIDRRAIERSYTQARISWARAW